MSQAMAGPQDRIQPTLSALALLLGAIKPCSAWAPAKQAEVHAPDCASHGLQQEAVPLGCCLTWALLTSPQESGRKLDRTAVVLPLGCGVWLHSRIPGLCWVRALRREELSGKPAPLEG